MTVAGCWQLAPPRLKTIRIAEHRQARIDALKTVVPDIEKKYNVHIEVVEYPAPEKDYLTKLLTELRAGNAPDIFNAPHGSDVADMVAAGYLAPITTELKAWDGYSQLFDVGKAMATGKDGQIYALPAMLDVMQLYYRRDILEKAGISTEQPKTWAELLKPCQGNQSQDRCVWSSLSGGFDLGHWFLRGRLQAFDCWHLNATDRH